MAPSAVDRTLDQLIEGRDASTAIDAWLTVLSRLLHLPEAVRSEIVAELREHLRDRVRDITLAGGAACDESQAVRQAIEELGETAHLAHRFEAANRPRSRRTLMHTIAILTGAGAIAAGVWTFAPNERGESLVPSTRFEADAPRDVQPPASLAEGRFELAGETSLRQALEAVTRQAQLGLMVDWGELESCDVLVDEPMGLSFSEMPGERTLTLIAEAASRDHEPLDWRIRPNNLIEFGVKRELDRREVELVTYDITATIRLIAGEFTDSHDQATEQIMELLTTMVQPENWIDNGGDLAMMKLVGGRLFVQAPTRMQEKIQWILKQLPSGEQAKAEAGNAPANAAGELTIGDIHRMNDYLNRIDDVSKALAANDVVTVHIYELFAPNEWSSATRVIDTWGSLRVSEIGDVHAAGLTVAALQQEIINQLKTAGKAGTEPKVKVRRGSDQQTGVPILSDLPVLNSYFTSLDDAVADEKAAELQNVEQQLQDAVRFAEAELELLWQRLGDEDPQVIEAAKKLEKASSALWEFRRLQSRGR